MTARNKNISSGFIVYLALVALGCGTPATMPQGLPPTAKLIGQGRGFEYLTPEDGRIYRVYHGKVDGIRTAIKKGELYRAIGPVEGDDPTKDFDDYQYYFEPVNIAPVGTK